MIAGGIDLSVGSVVALGGIVAGVCYQHGLSPILAIAAAVGVCMLAGLINGLVTTKARMPAFIATLGMMGIARGLAQVLSGAVSIDVSPTIAAIGQNQWFFAGVILAVCVVTWLALTRTPFGRHCYAVGGNKEATRLSGVNVDKHMVKTFLFTGTIVGVGAFLMVARVGLANPTGSEGYELDSIAAAVIGGTSLFGGQGTVAGTLIGALIMAVLRNGCNLLNIDSNWQLIIIGAMIILAVFYDNVRRRRRP
jgi:ribose transport system permease protein